jgi:UDP-N-acetylmuramoyl-tripeptide--D-alanyl-D-alanine ligase
MLDSLIGLYGPVYPSILVYMLQTNEYHARPYLKWYWRTSNFRHVSRRRSLDKTPIASLLTLFLVTGITAQIIIGLALMWEGLAGHNPADMAFGLAVILTYPLVWAHLVVFPTFIGRLTVINRRNRKLSEQTRQKFTDHTATVIAVAGSYGKTSMKEILLTVLGEAKKVAATPANKNVITEHAKFARNLSGDEEVLIVEYGEEKPGDVLNFAEISQPKVGLITGLAPAHLDKYKTLAAAGKDIFSLADYLDGQNVFVNGDSEAVKPFLKPGFKVYSQKGIDKFKASDVTVDIDGTKFKLETNKASYQLHSRLIGKHHVGPLSAAIIIAEGLGLSKDKITKGINKTVPYEHRMEPKQIAGAWVLDDTYNGTIEGMKAGLSLLKELKAKRKIYVTPGIVDQGDQAQKVHIQLGKYIAEANPDMVILMRNSASNAIRRGIDEEHYSGIVKVQNDPLDFYSNLDKVVAVGDLVMMQNDWTDNYN